METRISQKKCNFKVFIFPFQRVLFSSMKEEKRRGRKDIGSAKGNPVNGSIQLLSRAGIPPLRCIYDRYNSGTFNWEEVAPEIGIPSFFHW